MFSSKTYISLIVLSFVVLNVYAIEASVTIIPYPDCSTENLNILYPLNNSKYASENLNILYTPTNSTNFTYIIDSSDKSENLNIPLTNLTESPHILKIFNNITSCSYFNISFSIDRTAPYPISSLSYTTTNNSINWTWLKPNNTDLTYIKINNNYFPNNKTYINLTSLTSNTSYNITIWALDDLNNTSPAINSTAITNITITPSSTPTPPPTFSSTSSETRPNIPEPTPINIAENIIINPLLNISATQTTLYSPSTAKLSAIFLSLSLIAISIFLYFKK